ncbi:MAG TPA: hypothetical protein VHO90_09915 [Bacteroidales bacterium]|nr:hypothetical protein [Bacteroidales bacterium]
MKKIRSCLIVLSLFATILISCESSDSDGTSGDGSGKGGSLARFTISRNYLYTVDDQNLKVFNISQADAPDLVQTIPVGFRIETIFTKNNALFIGSEWGMYIYDITNPTSPEKLCYYQHIYSCDPIVANDTLAYLTLRTESFCGRNTNELQVIDIRDLSNPKFVSSVAMTKPYGLGVDGKHLFVCDNGLKVLSLADARHPSLLKKFNIPALDVIADNNLLMVLAADGLYQYSYQNDTISFLSHIE